MTDAQIRQAMETCDKAQIHNPQALQGYGAIFGVDATKKCVAFCSSNINKWLPIETEKLLNAKIDDVFSDDIEIVQTKILNHKAQLPTAEHITIYGKNLFVRMINSSGFIIFELQDIDQCTNSDEHLKFLDKTNTILQNSNSTDELFTLYLDSIREYIGYDRIMLYKFDKYYDGEVICESKKEHMDTYLGHHFPATDIPESARKLYAKNPVRLIHDIDANTAPLIFATGYSDVDVDLSMINSRAVAPVHLEYLQNMSVKASMSISITIDGGQLWGLVACHNNTPKYIPLQKRLWCEQSAKILSITVQNRENAEKNYHSAVRHAILSEIVPIISNGFENTLKHTDSEITKLFLGLIKADGFALCNSKKIARYGVSPSMETISEIVNLIGNDASKPVHAISSLAALNPKLERIRKKATGVLFVRISELESIIWFRAEIQKRVAWAGQPIKKFYDDNGTLRLSPRKSFDTWYEEKSLLGEEWSDEDLYFVNTMQKAIIKSRSNENKGMRDIQDFCLSDKMFQIFDIMPQSVHTTDLDGIITYTNSAFTEMTGYSDKDALGRYTNILSSGKHDRAFYANIWTTILSMKIWRGKLSNRRANGEVYRVDATIAPILNTKGEIVGFVAIEHEITNLVLNIRDEDGAEESLEQPPEERDIKSNTVSNAELSSIKFKAKKEVLSQIAHHWRNPLAVISLYIQDISFAYLSNEITSEYISEYEHKCKQAIDQMTKTINDFATYFQPDDESAIFKPVDAVEEAVKALKEHLLAKNITVEIENQDGCCVFGHKSSLRCVIVEMLDNVYDAVVARNLDSAIAWVNIFKLDSDVFIEISDNCGGIENVENIFDPYYSTKGVASGFGLGLFEVKILVEQYLYGTVKAINGKLGAKFTIQISSKECK